MTPSIIPNLIGTKSKIEENNNISKESFMPSIMRAYYGNTNPTMRQSINPDPKNIWGHFVNTGSSMVSGFRGGINTALRAGTKALAGTTQHYDKDNGGLSTIGYKMNKVLLKAGGDGAECYVGIMEKCSNNFANNEFNRDEFKNLLKNRFSSKNGFMDTGDFLPGVGRDQLLEMVSKQSSKPTGVILNYFRDFSNPKSTNYGLACEFVANLSDSLSDQYSQMNSFVTTEAKAAKALMETTINGSGRTNAGNASEVLLNAAFGAVGAPILLGTAALRQITTSIFRFKNDLQSASTMGKFSKTEIINILKTENPDLHAQYIALSNEDKSIVLQALLDGANIDKVIMNHTLETAKKHPLPVTLMSKLRRTGEVLLLGKSRLENMIILDQLRFNSDARAKLDVALESAEPESDLVNIMSVIKDSDFSGFQELLAGSIKNASEGKNLKVNSVATLKTLSISLGVLFGVNQFSQILAGSNALFASLYNNVFEGGKMGAASNVMQESLNNYYTRIASQYTGSNVKINDGLSLTQAKMEHSINFLKTAASGTKTEFDTLVAGLSQFQDNLTQIASKALSPAAIASDIKGGKFTLENAPIEKLPNGKLKVTITDVNGVNRTLLYREGSATLVNGRLVLNQSVIDGINKNGISYKGVEVLKGGTTATGAARPSMKSVTSVDSILTGGTNFKGLSGTIGSKDDLIPGGDPLPPVAGQRVGVTPNSGSVLENSLLGKAPESIYGGDGKVPFPVGKEFTIDNEKNTFVARIGVPITVSFSDKIELSSVKIFNGISYDSVTSPELVAYLKANSDSPEKLKIATENLQSSDIFPKLLKQIIATNSKNDPNYKVPPVWSSIFAPSSEIFNEKRDGQGASLNKAIAILQKNENGTSLLKLITTANKSPLISGTKPDAGALPFITSIFFQAQGPNVTPKMYQDRSEMLAAIEYIYKHSLNNATNQIGSTGLNCTPEEYAQIAKLGKQMDETSKGQIFKVGSTQNTINQMVQNFGGLSEAAGQQKRLVNGLFDLIRINGENNKGIRGALLDPVKMISVDEEYGLPIKDGKVILNKDGQVDYLSNLEYVNPKGVLWKLANDSLLVDLRLTPAQMEGRGQLTKEQYDKLPELSRSALGLKPGFSLDRDQIEYLTPIKNDERVKATAFLQDLIRGPIARDVVSQSIIDQQLQEGKDVSLQLAALASAKGITFKIMDDNGKMVSMINENGKFHNNFQFFGPQKGKIEAFDPSGNKLSMPDIKVSASNTTRFNAAKFLLGIVFGTLSLEGGAKSTLTYTHTGFGFDSNNIKLAEATFSKIAKENSSTTGSPEIFQVMNLINELKGFGLDGKIPVLGWYTKDSNLSFNSNPQFINPSAKYLMSVGDDGFSRANNLLKIAITKDAAFTTNLLKGGSTIDQLLEQYRTQVKTSSLFEEMEFSLNGTPLSPDQVKIFQTFVEEGKDPKVSKVLAQLSLELGGRLDKDPGNATGLKGGVMRKPLTSDTFSSFVTVGSKLNTENTAFLRDAILRDESLTQIQREQRLQVLNGINDTSKVSKLLPKLADGSIDWNLLRNSGEPGMFKATALAIQKSEIFSTLSPAQKLKLTDELRIDYKQMVRALEDGKPYSTKVKTIDLGNGNSVIIGIRQNLEIAGPMLGKNGVGVVSLDGQSPSLSVSVVTNAEAVLAQANIQNFLNIVPKNATLEVPHCGQYILTDENEAKISLQLKAVASYKPDSNTFVPPGGANSVLLTADEQNNPLKASDLNGNRYIDTASSRLGLGTQRNSSSELLAEVSSLNPGEKLPTYDQFKLKYPELSPSAFREMQYLDGLRINFPEDFKSMKAGDTINFVKSDAIRETKLSFNLSNLQGLLGSVVGAEGTASIGYSNKGQRDAVRLGSNYYSLNKDNVLEKLRVLSFGKNSGQDGLVVGAGIGFRIGGGKQPIEEVIEDSGEVFQAPANPETNGGKVVKADPSGKIDPTTGTITTPTQVQTGVGLSGKAGSSAAEAAATLSPNGILQTGAGVGKTGLNGAPVGSTGNISNPDLTNATGGGKGANLPSTTGNNGLNNTNSGTNINNGANVNTSGAGKGAESIPSTTSTTTNTGANVNNGNTGTSTTTTGTNINNGTSVNNTGTSTTTNIGKPVDTNAGPTQSIPKSSPSPTQQPVAQPATQPVAARVESAKTTAPVAEKIVPATQPIAQPVQAVEPVVVNKPAPVVEQLIPEPTVIPGTPKIESTGNVDGAINNIRPKPGFGGTAPDAKTPDTATLGN